MLVFLQKPEQTLVKMKGFLGDRVSGEDEAKAVEACSTIMDLLTHPPFNVRVYKTTVAGRNNPKIYTG